MSDSAATEFHKDLVRLQMGKLTLNDLRTHWKNGKYKGVPEQWLKEWKRLAR